MKKIGAPSVNARPGDASLAVLGALFLSLASFPAIWAVLYQVLA